MLQVLAAAVAASLLAVAECVICDNSVTYNGQCTTYGTCQGSYCIYEYTLQNNGQTMLKKACSSTPNVQFDDGSFVTVYNQCVTKTTNAKSYIVKVCYNGDYCNRQCNNPQPLPPMSSRVTCYSCSTTNGADCMTGSCTDNYCTYSLHREPSGEVKLWKGCTSYPQLQLDDGTMLTHSDTCQTRTTTTGSTYTAKICNTDHCNAECTLDNDPNGPQREPTVSCTQCEAYNANDCTGVTCQGNYCVYESSVPQNGGVPYVKRSCAMASYAQYPDGTRTQATNQCERKVVYGVSYAVEVCNSGSFCDTRCNSVSPIPSLFTLLILPFICLLK